MFGDITIITNKAIMIFLVTLLNENVFNVGTLKITKINDGINVIIRVNILKVTNLCTSNDHKK